MGIFLLTFIEFGQADHAVSVKVGAGWQLFAQVESIWTQDRIMIG